MVQQVPDETLPSQQKLISRERASCIGLLCGPNRCLGSCVVPKPDNICGELLAAEASLTQMPWMLGCTWMSSQRLHCFADIVDKASNLCQPAVRNRTTHGTATPNHQHLPANEQLPHILRLLSDHCCCPPATRQHQCPIVEASR